MVSEKIKCRDCGLCDVKEEKCSLTGRQVTLDSMRNCKKGIRRDLIENQK